MHEQEEHILYFGASSTIEHTHTHTHTHTCKKNIFYSYKRNCSASPWGSAVGHTKKGVAGARSTSIELLKTRKESQSSVAYELCSCETKAVPEEAVGQNDGNKGR